MMKLSQLTPRTSTWMHEIINAPSFQTHLFQKYDTPVNIHHLPTFDHNINLFKKHLDRYECNSKTFFTRKANKCRSLVNRAFKNSTGVNVASYNELDQCLKLHIPPSQLILIAAAKNPKLLRLAITNNVLIILDNEDEYKLTLQLGKELNTPAIIGFHISGFKIEDVKSSSRFGFDIDRILTFISDHKLELQDHAMFLLEGLYFCLDNHNSKQRSIVTHQVLDMIEHLKQIDIVLKFIKVSGEILINYLDSHKEWTVFQNTIKSTVPKKSKAKISQIDGLAPTFTHYAREKELQTYPLNTIVGPKFLDKILNSTNNTGISVVERLRHLDLEFRIELGKSLLDQVGITIARVAYRKRNAVGDHLIGLEMNKSQLLNPHAHTIADPFVAYHKTPDHNHNTLEVYFVGSHSLEGDFLLKRKITIPKLPAVGDGVIFVNTASYFMHFYETQVHSSDLSTNLIIDDYNKDVRLD